MPCTIRGSAYGSIHFIPDGDLFCRLGSPFSCADRLQLTESEVHQYSENNSWLETCQFFELFLMNFFTSLTEAINSRQSLMVTGLDPNPEMLRAWAQSNGLSNRSVLSQARSWCKAAIDATEPHVCAFKPSLGFYQAMGSAGLELLQEVRELIPAELPLIIDIKHGDLNSSTVIAQYVFNTLMADAVTINPLSGHDIAAPFLVYPGKGVVLNCHSSNPAARPIQHHPDDADPLYLKLIQEAQAWGTPEQLLLEIGSGDPAVLSRVRQAAPERFLMLRSIWGEGTKLQDLLKAGLNSTGDGLLLPLPQNLLNESNIDSRVMAIKNQVNQSRQIAQDAAISESSSLNREPELCRIWPQSKQPFKTGPNDDLRALVIDLYDIRCLLFGRFQQASGQVFNYYIDLRQIISDPALFQRVLACYATLLSDLSFDRIAGIPYGSLPTATGLSLQLHKPLLYPRKEVKAHGTRRMIEGEFNPGDRIAVVDDILITGGSVLEGVGKLNASGLEVKDVVVFLDHGGHHDSRAKQRLADVGIALHAVLTLDEIADILLRSERITADQAQDLIADAV